MHTVYVFCRLSYQIVSLSFIIHIGLLSSIIHVCLTKLCDRWIKPYGFCKRKNKFYFHKHSDNKIFKKKKFTGTYIYLCTAYILGFRCLNHRMHNVNKNPIRFPTTQQNIIYRYSTYITTIFHLLVHC